MTTAIQILQQHQKNLVKLVPPKAVDFSVPDIIRQADYEIRNNQKLANCRPESLAKCVREAIQVGLNISGSLRQAALVPYGNECKLDIQYQGLIDLIMRTGMYKAIFADVIYRSDVFKAWNDSEGKHFRHEIGLGDREDSEIIGVYSVAIAKDGTTHLEIMSRAQIDRLEQTTRKGSNMTPAWRDWFGEMAKKTVIKRMLKWLPKTPEVNRAVTIENNTSQEPQQLPKPEEKKPEVVDAVMESAPDPEPVKTVTAHDDWPEIELSFETNPGLKETVEAQIESEVETMPIEHFDFLKKTVISCI